MSKMADFVKILHDDDSESDGRLSPDAKCSICLGKLDEKSSSDSCFHFFCFKCLYKWSQIKAECPLCKQPFKLIYYNFKASGAFEKMDVPSTVESTTLQHNYNVVVNMFGTQYGGLMINPISLPSFASGVIDHPYTSGRFRAGVPNLRSYSRTLSRPDRRSVYLRNAYITGFRGNPEPPRESSPSYYSANPSQLDRLRPWLMRELLAIGNPCATAMTNRLLNALRRVHITSHHFRFLLSQCVEARFVDHFIHEFRIFANSVYDMRGFDENARYAPSAHTFVTSTAPPIELDSDVEVIHETIATANSEQANEQQPLVITESPDIVISDNESGVEIIDIKYTDVVNSRTSTAPTEVLLISSDDEHEPNGSTSKTNNSGSSSNLSQISHDAPGPSTRLSPAPIEDVDDDDDALLTDWRKHYSRIKPREQQNTRRETEFRDYSTSTLASRKKNKFESIYEARYRSRKMSPLLKMNPVHFHHKNVDLSERRREYEKRQQRLKRRIARRLRIEESSSDDEETLAEVAARVRVRLRKRLRRCLAVAPPSSTVKMFHSDEALS